MIKINKQVAKSKISRFLEINQVILLFHCNNSVLLDKNGRLLDLNKNQGTGQTPIDRVTSTKGVLLNDPFALNINAKQDYEGYKKHLFTKQKTFKSMLVKNRLAKKIFLDLKANKLVYPKDESLLLKKKKYLTTSLFQGPTLLLGCSDIKVLEKGIEICSKYKELILLGAIYDKSIINHLQVKKLITYSNNSQGYVKLLSSMRDSFLRPFSLIRELLGMRCLFAQQNRLICLLQARKEQKLIDDL